MWKTRYSDSKFNTKKATLPSREKYYLQFTDDILF
jgi:hypothetical protein